jgi:hypothetical protein
VEVEV